MDKVFTFKRKTDKQIVAGWVLACIPFSWAIFSLAGLISRPSEIPYVVFLVTAPVTVPLAVFVVISLFRMSTAVFTIDDTRIVIRDFLGKKEILWSDVADIQHNTTTVNGVKTASALALKKVDGKILLSFPCPPESSFTGDGNLLEILLSIYNRLGEQRTEQTQKAVPRYAASGPDGVGVYRVNIFSKIFLHLVLALVLIGITADMFSKPSFGQVCFGLLIIVAIAYLGLINLHSRFTLTKDALQYSNFLQKEIQIPWLSIMRLTHHTGLMNNIVLEATSGEIKLRGIALLNGTKLFNDMSLRRQLAWKENGK